ncbi:glutamate--tRNA ligase [Parvularcula sp. IMCC14364]|uniref:glutamate--tRNA ligase n=1 Tax=Parvularcula sp. IMCC14364 TaxID=3067902 RepID=UPI0027423A85|nr:glutamate--tRNA ligase [Parvularcula sp. IMCC14364]
MNSIVTRFAPSPTGYLHIGGARTALFNWLYARGEKAAGQGQFLLRIEDTDRARHNEAAVAAILDGLSWLGIDWDGEPISQFARAERHAEVARQLLSAGHAYRCWLTGEELDAARQHARENNTRFESPWRDHEGQTPDGPYAIRLKAPSSGDLRLPDQVQGEVRFSVAVLDDMVLLRSDGTPTYMLAVVVDDHDMAVTHIIRGDDHLINGARQMQLYDALGWTTPVFAHIPLIHGSDGAKLSKRHGALGVEAYRDLGYLPEGLSNYLLRLGWAHGDDEIIPVDNAKKWFDFSGINKSPARLDLDKLDYINAHYLRDLEPDRFIELATPFLQQAGLSITQEQNEQLLRAVPFLKERASNLADTATAAMFIMAAEPFDLTGKAAKPLKKEGALDTLKEVRDLLTQMSAWDETQLEEALQQHAEAKDVGFGQIGPPVRAALTGGNPSPSLGQVLYVLGRDVALARLDYQIS